MKAGFLSYHPFLTYTVDEKYFIGANGRPTFSGWESVSHPTDMNRDALDLWDLGKNAFDALPKFNSKDEFDNTYESNLQTINFLKQELSKRSDITFVNSNGQKLVPDFDNFEFSDVANIAWELGRLNSLDFNFLAVLFLFSCLQEVDNAIMGMCLENDAISAAIAAANAYANFQSINSGNEGLQKARATLAKHAALRRHATDPLLIEKQIAKVFIRECWEEWQKKPDRYETQSKFAIDVTQKIKTNENGDPIISFDTIIKKWIPLWSKEKK
ncbi:MAG: hypothetical protein K2Y28_13570 [Burkholderiaceae bacterium]|nr:hypothetical protein [Burkholderiaceae bacterium]